jgi:tRNA threonylcarbamoyladenosine modification (KEOPS) complex Cgi121 subunit
MQFDFAYVKLLESSRPSDVIDFCRSRTSIFQLLRCSSLISEEQVRIAVDMMDQIREKVNIQDEGILLMLLLAGTNQIKVAEDRVGISRQEAEYLCVYGNKKELEDFINSFDSVVLVDNPMLPEKDSTRDADTFMNLSRARFMLLNSSAISI